MMLKETRFARCVTQYLQTGYVHIVLADTVGAIVSMPGWMYDKRRAEFEGDRVFLDQAQAEGVAARMREEVMKTV